MAERGMEHGSCGPSNFDPGVHGALVAVASSAVGAKPPQLPWEAGWVAEVFGGGGDSIMEDVWQASPVACVRVPPATPQSHGPAEEIVFAVKRARRDVPYAGLEAVADQAREKEVKLWFDIVWRLGQRSRVAQDLLHMSSSGKSLPDLLKFLGMIVNDREPSTLRRHRLALEAWMAWKQEEVIWVPLDEMLVCQYMMAIADSGQGTSKALILLKSLLFIQHVFEVADLVHVTKSRKVRAAVMACQKKVRSRVVREPLTVQLVAHLEEVVTSEDVEPQRRLMSGLILACIYSRSRWTELQHAVSILEDEVGSDDGFVEFILPKVKTLKAELRGKAKLSVVAPAVGVTGLPWAKAWLELRTSRFPDRHELAPLLPVPLSDGGWGSRPITSTEGTAWIRSLASDILDHDKIKKFSTHSCKATTLSWVCKYGVDESVRALLGYHRAGRHRMLDCYGRDYQAPALRVLCEVLSKIRDCSFKPDETRSGRFSKGKGSGKDVGRVEQVSSSSDSPSPSSHVDTLSGSSSHGEGASEELAEGSLVKHRRYGTIHKVWEVVPSPKAACGVAIDLHYVHAGAILDGSWCKKCFKGRIGT